MLPLRRRSSGGRARDGGGMRLFHHSRTSAMDAEVRCRLFGVHESVIRQVARRLSSSADDANDLVQDVAVIVFTHHSGPPDAESFVGWCGTVAHHLAMHRRRSSARTSFFNERLKGLQVHFGGHPETAFATRQHIKALLDQLDDDTLSLLWHRFVLEETSVEIAERLHISTACVRMRLSRVAARVREANVDPTPQNDGHDSTGCGHPH
jgi:RNA polymerase sigma factor (sigma-70 family)